MLKQERRGGGGRLRQDEDRGRNARATKLDALVHRGDGQLARAGGKRRPRHLHGAVSVAIGLHDGHQARARLQAALVRIRVMPDGTKIDLDPGPATLVGFDIGQTIGAERFDEGGAQGAVGRTVRAHGAVGRSGRPDLARTRAERVEIIQIDAHGCMHPLRRAPGCMDRLRPRKTIVMRSRPDARAWRRSRRPRIPPSPYRSLAPAK